MAVILVLDRVSGRGRKKPTIQRIVCDGFLLYSEKGGKEETECKLRASQAGVSALGIARTLLQTPSGKELYHQMREELARLAAEEKAKEQREKWREAEEAQHGAADHG